MFTLSDSYRSLTELQAIPVPESARWASRTRHSRWRPIQHGELATTLLDEADSLGLAIHEHTWETTGPGHTELFGSIDFEHSPTFAVPDGMVFSLGVRHSNAGRYALTIVTGARVMVCTNGVLVGERVLARRHTEDLDLRGTLRRSLQDAITESARVGDWVTRLQGLSMSDDEADRMMMAAARRRVLAWSALKGIDAAWRRPPHEAFQPRTAWSLYNAFTEVARNRSPEVQLRALRGLRRLFGSELDSQGGLEALSKAPQGIV